MTATDVNGWAVPPLRVLEIPPNDEWFASNVALGAAKIPSAIFKAELALPQQQRAPVLYFDLDRFTMLGNVIDPVVTWARLYRESLPSESIPATLLAIGKNVPIDGRRRLTRADVYYLNEGRRSLQRLMGSGDRSQRIYTLIQSLAGTFAMPAFPHGLTTSGVSSQQTAPQKPSAWEAYTKPPQHVDPAEVETLFKKLTKKPEDWERDD